MADRFDKSSIIEHRLDHNGYLNVKANATRAGIFTYRHADGSVTRELRHPDEVFKADSLATLKKRPVVDNHPRGGMVTARNTRGLAIGMNGDRTDRTDDDHVGVDLIITDDNAINKITADEHPKVELSCGYKCDVIEEIGTFNGEHYDHVQKNIVYNHIALVDKGRAGAKARIYLDSADGAVVDDYEVELSGSDNPKRQRGDSKMTIKLKREGVQVGTFKLDSVDIEIHEDSEKAVESVLARADSAVARIRELEQEKADALGKVEKMQGTIDEMKTKHDAATSPEVLAELAKERADMCGIASHLGMKDFDSMTNPDLKRAIVAHANKGMKLDGKSEEYIEGRFDTVVDRIREENKNLQSLANLRKVTSPERTDEDDKSHKNDKEELSPREQFKRDSANMWQDNSDAA